MTGREFRAIRMFNNISQKDIALKLGFSCRDSVRRYENKEFLPHNFEVVLSEIVGYDFTNPNKLKEYVEKLPNDVFHLYKVVKRGFFWR